MTDLILYGHGAVARLIHSYVRKTRRVAAFTVEAGAALHAGAAPRVGTGLGDLPFAAFESIEATHPPDAHAILVAVGFVQMNEVRMRITAEARAKGYKIAGFVHPSVEPHDDVTIHESAVVLEHVSIHAGSRVGEGAFIAGNANLGHDCVLEDYVWMNAGVALGGGTDVGRGSFFGVNASTRHGVRLGAQTLVGPNAHVAQDTNDGDVVLTPPGEVARMKSKAFLKFIAAAAGAGSSVGDTPRGGGGG